MKHWYCLFILFFIVGTYPSFSQSIVFEKYFSKGDFPARMAETPTGEFLITGIRDVNASIKYRLYLSKFDGKGNLIWQLQYTDTTHLIIPKDLKVGLDSTYYLLATYATSDYTNSKILLMHFDTTGNILWAKTYSSNSNFDAAAMQISKVGAITIAANTGSDITNYQSVSTFFMNVNQDGDLIWDYLFDLWYSGNYVSDIKTLSNGDIIASCGFYGSHAGAIKIKLDGTLDWMKIYQAGIYWVPQSIITDNNSNIWLAGEVTYPSDLAWMNWSVPCIMKLQEDGTAVFFKLINREWKGTWFQKILQTWDSNYALSMFFQDNYSTKSGAVLVKIDSSGSIMWSRNYEKNLSLYYFQDMMETSDSGLAGTNSISFSAYNNYSFFKTDKNGHTCADTSFDFQLSDTSFSSINYSPVRESLIMTIDSITVPIKQIIPNQFIICEDDSFVSVITSSNENFTGINGEVNVFPNPTNDFFILKTERDFNENSEMRVYDLSGHLLFKHHITSSDFQFGEELVVGVYILELIDNNRSKIFKIIKSQ